jgi:hypothetical protein
MVVAYKIDKVLLLFTASPNADCSYKAVSNDGIRIPKSLFCKEYETC